MKKTYSELSINEKINLKNNFKLGETNLERCVYKTGQRFSRLWKGVGAMLKLNNVNRDRSIKNFDHPVDYSKTQTLILPTIFGT